MRTTRTLQTGQIMPEVKVIEIGLTGVDSVAGATEQKQHFCFNLKDHTFRTTLSLCSSRNDVLLPEKVVTKAGISFSPISLSFFRGVEIASQSSSEAPVRSRA